MSENTNQLLKPKKRLYTRLGDVEAMETKRQGDILLIKVEELPRGVNEVGDKVLAYGEVTGHKHQVQQQIQVFREEASQQTYVQGKGLLVHEEHDSIPLNGTYRVVRQREYSPLENRLVQD